jgi:hypothetical protein
MLYKVTYGSSTRTGRQVRYRPCYISPMVRRLVYIIAAIIALQFSWTAVSAYCTHETGKAAQHFGHHQHVEDGDEVPFASKDAPSVVKKFAVHRAITLRLRSARGKRRCICTGRAQPPLVMSFRLPPSIPLRLNGLNGVPPRRSGGATDFLT